MLILRPNGAGRLERSPKSGEKYRTVHGIVAVRDGVRRNRLLPLEDVTEPQRKPPWIRVRIGHDARFQHVKRTVDQNRLATVCEESHCPNIGECWSHGTATIMLMGAVCTRACRFCAVDTGNPRGWLDPEEPAGAAESVRLMGLRYVVLTSVDRDDLEDGGAKHYAECIGAIKQENPTTVVEALCPDFQGKESSVLTVVTSGVDVFAQNLETVRRLTHTVRDPRAGYQQSLDVLGAAKRFGVRRTKSSLMLGLGETESEVQQSMEHLVAHGVDYLTLGQYLRPTENHLPVVRWIHPDEFDRYRELALETGFRDVASGPLVRSSYRADRLAAELTQLREPIQTDGVHLGP